MIKNKRGNYKPKVKICPECGQEFETVGKARICKICKMERELRRLSRGRA